MLIYYWDRALDQVANVHDYAVAQINRSKPTRSTRSSCNGRCLTELRIVAHGEKEGKHTEAA